MFYGVENGVSFWVSSSKRLSGSGSGGVSWFDWRRTLDLLQSFLHLDCWKDSAKSPAKSLNATSLIFWLNLYIRNQSPYVLSTQRVFRFVFDINLALRFSRIFRYAGRPNVKALNNKPSMETIEMKRNQYLKIINRSNLLDRKCSISEFK